MPQILVDGLTESNKVPGDYRQTKYGAGGFNAGAGITYCLLIGIMDETNGDATPDQVYDITSKDEAIARFGPRSEITRQCLAALLVPGVSIKAIGTSEGGSAVQATLTVTVGGSWATSGELGLRLGGKTFWIPALATDTPTDVAARITPTLAECEVLFCTASNVAAVSTLTVDSAGLRGNLYSCFVDLSRAPTGLTATLGGGGTSLTGGGLTFSSGAVADDITNALATMLPGLYDFIGAAQNDTTNAALLESQVNTKAGALVGKLEHYVLGFNGTQTNAAALAQTTLNDQRGCVVHHEEGESHPSELAAVVAAIRSVINPRTPQDGVGGPNHNYDDYELPYDPKDGVGVAPLSKEAAAVEPTNPELDARLNLGITPVKSENGVTKIVRGITSRSLNGTNPDYSTLDWGAAEVPDSHSKRASGTWKEWKAANPQAGPDPDIEGGESPAPSGTGTPTGWKVAMASQIAEENAWGWWTSIEVLPVWNATAERVMAAHNGVVRPLNHQIGILINQRAA